MQLSCPPGYNCNWSMGPAQDNSVAIIAVIAIVCAFFILTWLCMVLYERQQHRH